MAIGAVIAGVLGIGGIAASAASNSASQRAQNEAIDRQYDYDTAVWNFNFDEQKREYDYLKQGIGIQRQNIEDEYFHRDYLAKQDWAYQMRIADFEYSNALRQHAQSEKNYRQQLQFNNIAAAQAYESEQRKLNEIKIGQAFQQQDLMVKSLQEEGAAQVTGQAGRSQGKAMQSAVAAYGRNLAVLAESLTSAEKQFKTTLRKIDVEKMGADLAAEAARMIRPERAPAMPKPIELPRPLLQDPLEPKQPPKPIKGAKAANTLGLDVISGVANLGMGIASSYIGKE